MLRCLRRRTPRLLQILRQRVQQCYRTEGVNHYENCREVRRGDSCLRVEGFGRGVARRSRAAEPRAPVCSR